MKKPLQSCIRYLLIALLAATTAMAQTQNAGNDSSKMAIVDGGAGRCSIELTVLGPEAKPVYGATVRVHIAYGFGGFHKLDLEGGTNSDGKVKFIGIPERVKRTPLEFEASKDDLTGTATQDPATRCVAIEKVSLQKAAPATAQ